MRSVIEEILMDERAFEDAMDVMEEMTERCECCGVRVDKSYIYQCVNCDAWVCGDCDCGCPT